MSYSSRRSFFKKLSFGLATSLTLDHAMSSTENKPKIIKKIEAMGFMWPTSDPFLFCVHHEDHFPQGKEDMSPQASLDGRSLGDDFIIKDGWRMYHGTKIPGFPGHPHRGFETITIVRKGMVDHADSLGAAGRYGEGDVQWMTAGKGVQHSEMFPLIHTDKANPLELFQIWLNLPAKSKMVNPHFTMLWGKKIPQHKIKDDNNLHTSIEIVAGSLAGLHAPAPPPDSWAADPAHEVMILNIQMEANARFTLPASKNLVNRTIYFYEGDHIILSQETIQSYNAVEVISQADIEIVCGSSPCKILVLQGKPIGEPVIQYGPFVMNTKEEIHLAFDDFHKTQFGGWPWQQYDQVHDRKISRFARHADGRFEDGL